MTKKIFLFFVCAFSFCCMTAFGQVSTTKWVRTHSWQGHGSMFTPIFKIYSESWRISCKLSKQSTISIRILDSTGKLVDKQSDSAPTTGFTSWSKEGKCDRILQIICQNTDWEVSVEQYMDISEEWKFRTDSKKKVWERVNAWGGTGAETFQYIAKNEECRLDFQQQNEGLFAIKITDEAGNYVAGNISRKEDSKYTTCIFKEGVYTIEISGDADWYVGAAVKLVKN